MGNDLRDISDWALVVEIGRWNHDALAEIYRRHAGPVFGLSNRLIGDRNRAEDVTQEIFLNLWNNPSKFDAGRGTLRTYLLTLTHGRTVDFIRSESSRRGREEREARNYPEAFEDIEREVVDLALAEEVKGAFEKLADDEREAIRLAYFGGHTYREVARILDQPEGTIKSRIRSGLKNLRQTLPFSMEEL